MGSVITSKKGLLKLVKGQINVEVDGSNQPAKDGEQLPKGAVLHIGENATYEITFDDGTKLSNEVAPNETAAPNPASAAALDEIQALQDLIASGEDPTQNLPETAAGNAPASDGNSGYVTLARSGSEVLATSGYSTSGQTPASTNTAEQTIAIDSPSVVVNDNNTVDEDTIATGNVLDNDSDVDSVLTVVNFEVGGTTYVAGTEVTLEGGILVLNTDGSYTFTPNENWNGSVPVITYTTNTGSTATLTIEVTPVDDASVLANDSNTVPEDTVAAGNVLDNDSDIDNTLSVASYSVNGQTIAAGTAVTLEGGSLLINADGSYTFTPNANWNGQVPVITYTTNTGSTATLTIEVTPVDDASVLANDSNTVPEDTVAAGNVLDNDSDIDNTLSVVSYSVNGQTITAGTAVTLEGGSLLINADGSYTFTPNANWNGQVPAITYTTNTGSTATLTIEVTPVDDASVLANDSNTVPEDTVAAGNVLDNDSDIDNTLSVVSYSVNGQTIAAGTAVTLEGGSLLINADGSYTFTPNENWNGSVPVITYTTNTGSTATLTIEVTPVDDASVLANDSNTVPEDTVAAGNVLNNDSDIDNTLSVVSYSVNGQTITAGTAVTLEGGSLLINADGSYTFTPNANWNGQVPVITYTTNTGSTATLTIEVTPVDDASVLANDSNTVPEDTVAAGNVLDNDSDIDNTLSVVSYSVNGQTIAAGTAVTLEGGSLLINADGSYTFTPNANWNGNVPAIAYTTNTGSTATLSIFVTPVNDAPVAQDDSFSVDEGSMVTGNVITHIDNNDGLKDSDGGDGATLTITQVNGIDLVFGQDGWSQTLNVTNGTLRIKADGTFEYTHDGSEPTATSPSFNYTLSDGTDTDTATVTISVDAVNDAPVAQDDSFSVDEGSMVTGNVITHIDNNDGLKDSDGGDGATLTITQVNGIDLVFGQDGWSQTLNVTNGTLRIKADGTFEYTHDGSEPTATSPSFNYTLSDGTDTDTATVTISVDAVNDAPVAQDDSFSVDEGSMVTGNVITHIDNNDGLKDSDGGDGATLTITQVNGIDLVFGQDGWSQTLNVTNGTLRIKADGTFEYTHDGSEPTATSPSFNYTLSDGTDTDTATVTISVDAVNDAPVAQDDSFSVDEGSMVTGNVITHIDNNDGLKDSDGGDGATLTITQVNGIDLVFGQDGWSQTLNVTNGTLRIKADGTFEYTHDGSEPTATSPSFNYTLSDGTDTDTATVTISVDAVNDAPVAQDDSFSVDEGSMVTGNVITHIDNNDGLKDSDGGDGATLTITQVNGIDLVFGQDGWSQTLNVTNGTLRIKADGTFEYTHDGSEPTATSPSFNYTLSDGTDTDTATVTISVDAVNDAPVAQDDSFSVDEGSMVTGNVITHIDNNDGLKDSDGGDGATLTITQVNGIDLVFGQDGWSQTLNVTNGTLRIKADGTFEYTHDGSEPTATSPSFNYTLSDGTDTDTATVTISVDAVNDAPVAQDDSFSVDEGSMVTGNVITHIDNNDGLKDSDGGDGATLTITQVNGIDLVFGQDGWSQTLNVTNGTLRIKADGTFEYTHDGSEPTATSPSFNYTLSDGTDTDTATVTISVDAVNDAPVAQDDSFSVDEGSMVTGNVITHIDNNDGLKDSDGGDGATLTITQVNGIDLVFGQDGWSQTLNVTNGTLRIKADGTFEYTHDGSEPTATSPSFNYTLSDGTDTDTATVTISVDAVNDAPVAQDDSFSVDEGSMVTGNVITHIDNNDGLKDSDGGDGATLTITQVNGIDLVFGQDGWSQTLNVTNGTLRIKADGTFEYTHDGSEPTATSPSFNYTLSDGTDTDTATVTISVDAVNDAPVAQDDSFSVDEGSMVTGNVITHIDNNDGLKDSDGGDGATLTITQVNGIDLVFGQDGWSQTLNVTNGTLRIKADGTFEYTHDGSEPTATSPSFNYTLSDGTDTDTATVTISVDAVNDAPVAQDDSFSVDEGSMVTGNVITHIDNNDGLKDSDGGDGATLTITQVNGIDLVFGQDGWSQTLNVTNGTLRIKADGTFEYTHDGSEPTATSPSFNYTLSDGTDTDTATVTISVDAVNDAPVAQDDSFSVDEGSMVTGNVITHIDNNDGLKDSDGGDGATLTITQVNGIDLVFGQDGWSQTLNVTNGTLRIKADGTFEYTHDGSEPTATSPSFNYTLSDGTDTDTATVTISVDAVNDAPVAQDDSFSVDEGSMVTGNVITHIDNNDGLKDSDGGDGATLTITQVNGIDLVFGQDGWSQTLNVTNGTLRIKADGTFEYTHDGSEPTATSPSFNYTLSDGTDTDTATVTISVDAVNDAPVAQDDSFSVDEGSMVTGNVITHIDNNDGLKDSDGGDGATLTITQVNGIDLVFGQDGWSQTLNVTNGTLRIKADGTFEYTHDGSEPTATSPSFNYTLSDGTDTDTATVTISVDAVNDAPVAQDDSFSVDEGSMVTGNVITHIDNNDGLKDSDGGDGATLTITQVNGIDLVFGQDGWSQTLNVTNGTLRIKADGTFEYTHDGSEPTATSPSFNYTLSDGTDTDTATVTISVDAVNDAPVAQDDSFSVDEGSMVTGNVITHIDNNDGLKDSDGGDGATLTITQVNGIDLVFGQDGWSQTLNVTNGTLRIKADGTFEYTHDGSEPTATSPSFNYTLSDGTDTDTATVTISVDAVNDAPVAQDDSFSVDEGSMVTGNVITHIDNNDGLKDSDGGDGATLTITQVNGIDLVFGQDGWSQTLNVTNGTLRIKADGTFEYTHDGSEPTATSPSFNYTLSDGTDTDTATVTISVDAVNDAPVAQDDSFSVDEGSMVTGNVITHIDNNDGLKDSDGGDGATLTITQVNGIDLVFGQDGWSQTLNVTNGTLRIKADGTFEYTHDGSEPTATSPSFNYTLSDGTDTDTATVTISVDAVNDAPVAQDDSFSVDEGSMVTGNVITHIDNNDGLKDSDGGDGATLTITQVNGIDLVFGQDGWSQTLNVTNGTLRIKADGTFEYTHDGSEPTATSPSFNYTLSDGTDTDTATVTISVDAVNDAPVAQDDSFSVDEGSMVTGNVITHIDNNDGLKDSDGGDGATLTITQVNGIDLVFGQDGWSQTLNVTNGTLRIKADGTFEYTHDGSEPTATSPSFNYTLSDGTDTDTATVTIGVNAVNDEVKIIGLDGTDKTVYEANLDSGTSPNNGALTQTGNFSFICNDGLLTVTIGGETLYLADLQALSVGTPVTINTDYGTLLLTGFSGDGTGGTISYTYILNQAVDNDDDAEATDSGFTDSFEVVVTDIDHDEDSATLDIRIVDDSVIADIADSEGENISGEVINGLFTDPVKGADTSYTADLSVNIAGWNANDPATWFAASNQTTGDSETIYYYVSESDPNTLYAYTDSGNPPTGWDGIGGAGTQELMFTLALNPNNGTYELVIHSPITTETEMGVNFTTNIGGNNYILYVNESGAITKTAPASTAFTLTATTNGLADTVNSSTNGYGVGSGKDIGNGELLTLTFSTSISAVETLVFTYNSGTTYTGEVTMILHGVNANGDPDTITLVGTSATLPALIEAQGWESISRIDLTTAPNGEEFNLHGLTTSTLEVDPTGTVLNFNANIVDSDGDIDSSNPFTVTLNAPNGLLAVTPNAITTLSENTLLSNAPDNDTSTMLFKAGSSNISNFSFSTDLNDIHVTGIRQSMNWRIEDGILIGSMPGRGDLLKLTLDWNAIEAGEEGSVVVGAELLGRLPHNINYDSLSVSGIKVVATDSSGQTVKADVTVSVADSQHIAVDDTNQVNVPIDSFEVRGITAEWTTWTAESSDSDVITSDSNDDDTANDRIRWGDVSWGEPRSGYNFDENTNIQVGDVGLNQNIILGTFTHLNYPIDANSAITKATLEVTLMINGVPAKVTLEFDHNETGSGGYNPPDIVTVANTSAVFIYDGARYTLQVMGFLDNNGNVVTSIETAENRSTSFPLVVKLIPGDGFELPEINGNVLHNDIQGADGNMEIYALSHYGSNASESNGSFIIQGTYGTLTLNDDGTYTYQVTTVGSLIPDNAVDKFSYTIRDSDGDLSSAELNISVNAVNGQPIAPPQPDETVYVGGQGVDSFQLNEWIGEKGLFAVSLGGHGSVASQTINDIISLDTALHVKAGASNDFVDLGISTANNIVETGSALPNVSNQLSQQDVLNSRFMSRNTIVDNDDHLKQNVLNEVQPKSDTVNLGEGDDTVYGGEGTQMVYGGAGNDLLIGGAGIDGLRGGAGNDTLIGGLGNDVLRGDSGADTFLWRYADADQGTDHIMDFNVNEDKLDLSDLLQGETANTLESYLNFSFNGTSTTITIDTDGTGSSTTSQVIILDGVDLSSIYGSTNEGYIINGLLTDGALIVDTQPVVFNDISSSLEPLKPNTEN